MKNAVTEVQNQLDIVTVRTEEAEETHTHTHTHTHTDTHTMEYYSAIKNEILTFAITRMELECIMLSEIS